MTRQEEKQKAIQALRAIVSESDTVYTIIRSSAENGSYRTMHVLMPRAGYQMPLAILRITELVCVAAGFRFDNRMQALGIGGNFATDKQAGDAIVSRLNEVLFGVGKPGLKHELL